ncbi:MAG: DNA repair protein RecO [Candidatus Firestonebacteria bacterium]
MMYHKTNGITLKTRSYGETSKLLTIYTRAFGKINALAKGAKKIKSRFGSSMELFTESKMMLYKKSTAGLYLVSQTEIISSFPGLSCEVVKFGTASVMSEFIYNFTPQGESNPALYNFYRASLELLNGSSNEENILMAFMAKFLWLSGYKMHLKTCASCGKEIKMALSHGSHKRISAKHGGVMCSECSHKEGDAVLVKNSTLKFLEYLQEKTYEKTGAIKAGETEKKEIHKVILSFLEYNFEGGVRSLRVMEEMGRYGS